MIKILTKKTIYHQYILIAILFYMSRQNSSYFCIYGKKSTLFLTILKNRTDKSANKKTCRMAG